MALIRGSKVKTSSGGYGRIFDDPETGDIFSKVHSANIRNGNELEKIIIEKSQQIPDGNLDVFISNLNQSPSPIADGTYLCTKKMYRNSAYQIKGHQPDFIIFNIDSTGAGNYCYIVEIKDGDEFDTKKSQAEHETLRVCRTELAPNLPCMVQYFICSFNQLDKEAIVRGFKGEFSIEEVRTGKELCDLLNIDYDEIVEERKADAEQNRKDIVEMLMGNEWFAQSVKDYLRTR